MLLNRYAISKEAQAFFKQQCNKHAFYMRLNFCDIYSLAHFRLAVQIHKNREVNDEIHLMNTLKYIAYNAAIDITTKASARYEMVTDPVVLPEHPSKSYQNHESKELLKIVDARIRKKFAHKPSAIAIYQSCIIDGKKYEETAAEFGIPMGTLKTAIYKIRQFALGIRYDFFYDRVKV